MDIKGIGQYTQPLSQPVRQQPASGAPAQAQPAAAPPRSAPPSGTRVQGRDLLNDEERSYLEMLFPGSTAAEAYGGKGKSPAPATGSIVDRKG